MVSDSTRTGGLAGAVGGVVAFFVGYVFTYALSISTVRDSLIAQFAQAFGDGGVAWKMVGWVFFNAHLATVTIDVDVPLFGGTSTVNLIAQSDALSALLYVVPPALLIAAGLMAARVAGVTEVSDAVRIGPAVALGYLPLVLAGVFLFTITAGESSGAPTLVTAVGLAGVVYPVVFGAVGAAFGAVTTSETAGRGATT